jgi:hypothetical protein
VAQTDLLSIALAASPAAQAAAAQAQTETAESVSTPQTVSTATASIQPDSDTLTAPGATATAAQAQASLATTAAKESAPVSEAADPAGNALQTASGVASSSTTVIAAGSTKLLSNAAQTAPRDSADVTEGPVVISADAMPSATGSSPASGSKSQPANGAAKAVLSSVSPSGQGVLATRSASDTQALTVANQSASSAHLAGVDAQTAATGEVQNTGQVLTAGVKGNPRQKSAESGVNSVTSKSVSASALADGAKAEPASDKQTVSSIANHSSSGNAADMTAHVAQSPLSGTGTGTEASIMARDFGDAHASAGVTAGTNASAAGSASNLTAQETFAALDAGTGFSTPSLTHASGHHAEAGFQDPTLGWVSVRADLSGGSIHASLVPESAAAAQTLGAHMEGLSNYLNEQRAAVSSLTMDTAGGSGSGMDQNMNQNAGQNANQQGAASTQSNWQAGTQTAAELSASTTSTTAADVNTPAYAGGSSGRYISVMA